MPAALPDARALLLAFDYVSIDDEVVDAAMNEPDRMLRSRDAIHLATARVLGRIWTAWPRTMTAWRLLRRTRESP